MRAMVDWSAPRSEASIKRLLYEIGLGVLVGISGIAQIIETQGSWLWFGVGIFSVVLIHAANYTPLGPWTEKWFNRIGIGGRFAVIVTTAVVIWGGIWYFKPSVTIIPNLVTGAACILVGIPLFSLLTRIRTNERQRAV